VIEQFGGLTVAEGEGAFRKQKSPIDLDHAGLWKVWRQSFRNSHHGEFRYQAAQPCLLSQFSISRNSTATNKSV
ncbi:hypothetical protein, partial [Mesorhizobium sp. M7A.F.Ca.CA.002.12.1.1]|uniref:hypothetical protein n=1 Tax=Mesorhizobium sp. M7A.F.Ca.CA.002.12.1.1 TaxID=2496735 RepID=UPI0019D032CB